KVAEQRMDNYPYSIEDFRYIGNPIEGIQFEDNQILFVTFKTKTSRLTPIQNSIKKLVTEGKVQWFEFKTK
ncbi:MAG: endonuclease, partial [Thermoplasmatales archaeon]